MRISQALAKPSFQDRAPHQRRALLGAPSFEDRRPAALAQRQLIDRISTNPRSNAHHSPARGIHGESQAASRFQAHAQSREEPAPLLQKKTAVSPTRQADDAVVQQVRIKDVDQSHAEVWEEVSYELFEERRIPGKHQAQARKIFDSLDQVRKRNRKKKAKKITATYAFYEDAADAVERRLCAALGHAFPFVPRTQEESGEGDAQPARSSSASGVVGTFLKVLVGYLALSSMLPTVRAQALNHDMNTHGAHGAHGANSAGGIGDATCTVDAMGQAVCGDMMALTALSHVRCEPSVMDLCGKVRANPIYDGLLKAVDQTCESIDIQHPQNKVGACVFTPAHGVGGLISCKQIGDYDNTKIGHELEHAFDLCRTTLGQLSPAATVVSEVHAHTVQAAIAKYDLTHGATDVDMRDRDLVRDFDHGCPTPGSTVALDNVGNGMYAIAHIYHRRYVKKDLSRKDLEGVYGPEIRKAVARYKDMVQNGQYEKAHDKKYKQIK